MPDATAILDAAVRRAFTRPPPLPPSAWADEHRELVMAERKGRWRTSVTPYLREVMDAADDPAVREVVIMKCTQSGGTEALYNILMWWIDRRPSDTIWAWPNIDLARKWNKKRLLPSVRRSPAVLRWLGKGREDATSLELNFTRMFLFFVGTQSEANVEGVPCGRGIVDELDRCAPGTADNIRKRCATYADAKIVFNGTPGLEDVGIAAEFAGTDRRRWWTPCPHPKCGAYQTRDWSMVRWPDPETGPDGKLGRSPKATPAQIARIAREAVILCKHCRRPIGPEHQAWQAARGVWCPEGCSVAPDGRIIGDIPRTSRRGYHITGLDSTLHAAPPNPYGAVAARWVTLMNRADVAPEDWQNFYNHDLGVPYTPKGESLEVGELRSLAGPSGPGGGSGEAAPFKLGQVPDWCVVLTAGVDVQQDRAYVVVRGWGPGGVDAALVWHGVVPLPQDQGLAPLDGVLLRSRREWKRMDGSPIPLAARFIDSGHRTIEVYDYCKARHRPAGSGGGGDTFAPVKGIPGAREVVPWEWTKIERSTPGGQRIVDGQLRLNVYTWVWADRMVGRLRARLKPPEAADDGQQGQEGQDGEIGSEAGPALGLAADVKRLWLPSDVGGELLAHLTSEHKVVTRMAGRVVLAWQLKPGRTDNHYRDALIYDEAGADACGVRDLPARPAGPAAAPPRNPSPHQPKPAKTTTRSGGLAARQKRR